MIIDGILSVVGSVSCICWIVVGVIVGLIFGAVPGLSAPMAVILFLPMTFGMDPILGISLLVALYTGSTSGGLISAILLKIPGTPASIATVWDGGPMCDRGEAGRALGIGVLYSFIGGIISAIALIFVSPYLAKVAMKFSSFEYSAISFMSLAIIASVAGDSLLNGLISGLLGMFFSMVGVDSFSGVLRYTFGNRKLLSGFGTIPVLIGFFAIAEMLKYAFRNSNGQMTRLSCRVNGFGVSMHEFWQQLWNMFRSALIGIGVGILPGIGGSTSSIFSYSIAKNSSKHPEKFGTGIIDGIVASETANNATVGGALIPLLTLGIPGSTVCAVLLGGLQSHGIFPGPMIFQSNGTLIYGIFAAFVLANIVFFLVEYKGINLITKVLQVPTNYLLPIVVVMSCVGAFGNNNRVFDVMSIFFFSILAVVMSHFHLPTTPFIIGFVLGPMTESHLRRALMSSEGSALPFFTRPISLVFIIISFVMLAVPLWRSFVKKRSKN